MHFDSVGEETIGHLVGGALRIIGCQEINLNVFNTIS